MRADLSSSLLGVTRGAESLEIGEVALAASRVHRLHVICLPEVALCTRATTTMSLQTLVCRSKKLLSPSKWLRRDHHSHHFFLISLKINIITTPFTRVISR